MSEVVDYTQSDVPVPTPKYTVFHKAAWADDWEEAPTVDLLKITDGAGQVAHIELAFSAGKMLREEATEYATEEPLDWHGQFVMVEWYAQDDTGAPTEEVLERWIGKAMLEDQEVLGADVDGVGAVDQKILVRGLEHLLDEVIVTGSWIASAKLDGTSGEDDDPVAVHVDTPMTFNAPRNGPVPWDRNSSAAVVSDWYKPGATELTTVPQNHDDGSGPSVFDEVGDDTLTWKIGDILDYLVCFYSPEIAEDVRFRTATIEPTMSAPGDGDDTLGTALYEMVAPPMRFEGHTLLRCLNALLRPERGLGWRLMYDDDTRDGSKGPIIHVFSIQATAVTVDATSFPAASNPVTLVLTDRRDGSWQTRRDAADEFGKIVVRGEELLTCFSISKADGSLAKGWTSQEETAYASPPDAGSEGDDDFDEKVAKYRARSRVWAQFILDDDWNMSAKNGEGSGSGNSVNPTMGDDATPDYTKHTSMARWDRRFERFVPIVIEKPDGAEDDPKPQYYEPLAFIKEPFSDTTSWIDLVNNLHPQMPSVSLYEPLEDRPGFHIRTDPNHLLSGGNVEGDETDDSADWEDMILTVAMRTGARLALTKTIDDAPDDKRTLIIDVDHAERWTILAGTVIKVKADGTLERKSTNTHVRDDVGRLKVVRDLATAWYGQFRKPVSVQFRSLTIQAPTTVSTDPLPLTNGRYVARLEEGGGFGVDVKTVITARAFDFVNNTSAFETGYGERPEFGNLA